MAGSTPNIVLVGLPGVGKTSCGRDAARELGWPFIDFDTEIEHRVHASIPEIFARDGEGAFRALERSLTAELAGCSRTVMSTGGGWITNSDAVALLRGSSRIIYLRASTGAAMARMRAASRRRPLLDVADPHAAVRRLLDERGILYAAADYVIDTELLDRKEVTRELVRYALTLQ